MPEKAEAIGRYSFEVKRLTTGSSRLRSARFWRPLSSSRVLSGRSGVNSVPLRTVKVAPARHIWRFRKPCAVVKSDGMICLCQTPLTPRAALPLRRRACLLLTPNCQRPSALSQHT